MNKLFLYLFLPLFCLSMEQAPEYPVPPASPELLFYLQRSINKNTLLYELNTDKEGRLVAEEPIRISWINYENKQEREPLNFFQRTLAYGIELEVIDKAQGKYRFRFVSYKGRYFYLLRSQAENRYRVYTSINKETSEVRNIYAEVEKGLNFFSPKVHYVKLEGINPATGKETVEIIHP
jgi:hypothetical protein